MGDRSNDDTLSSFGFLLKDVSRLYSRNFERHCAALGLTLSECRVLGHLRRHEGISQARLADLTDSDPMTLGRLLVRMEACALVERRPAPSDGRAFSLYLCPQSGPLLDEIGRLSVLARAEAMTGLSAVDQSHLLLLLQRLRENLDALMPGLSDGGGPVKPPTQSAPLPRRVQRKAA